MTTEKKSEKKVAAKVARSQTSGINIFVRQVRSSTRSRGQHVKTLLALGLGKCGKTNTLPDNQAVRGMLRSVIQWLEVKHV
ncbi:MAG: 50S ribosomal protein L30 [bacterium]